MVVNAANGKFLSMRTHPRLTFVAPDLPPEALECDSLNALPEGLVMTVRAPGMEALRIPLVPTYKLPEINVSVWEHEGKALDEGDVAAKWFSKFLNQPVRLVRHTGVRPCDDNYTDDMQTAYSDGFPILLASEDSLADLNVRVETEHLAMQRFRPNIVVEGGGRWDEDTWQTIRLVRSPPLAVKVVAKLLKLPMSVARGLLRATRLHLLLRRDATRKEAQGKFFSVKPCSRCKMTTMDPETAIEGMEPLVIFDSFRKGKQLGFASGRHSKQAGWGESVFFGWNLGAAPLNTQTVNVGDTVAVLTRRQNIGDHHRGNKIP